MYDFVLLLATLICCHFLLDFGIQGDFVAKFKARIIDGNTNTMWKWVLTAHAAAHTLPILLLTKSIPLGLLMFTSHFIIDMLKCEQKIDFNQDQTFHLIIILAIVTLTLI